MREGRGKLAVGVGRGKFSRAAVSRDARCSVGAISVNKKKQQLPRFLKPYFWETDLARVHPQRHAFYLIERVIEYGDDRAIHWLKTNFTPAQIARVVRTSRAISPNTANLWALILGIPRSKVKCFSKPSRLPRSAFSRG